MSPIRIVAIALIAAGTILLLVRTKR